MSPELGRRLKGSAARTTGKGKEAPPGAPGGGGGEEPPFSAVTEGAEPPEEPSRRAAHDQAMDLAELERHRATTDSIVADNEIRRQMAGAETQRAARQQDADIVDRAVRRSSTVEAVEMGLREERWDGWTSRGLVVAGGAVALSAAVAAITSGDPGYYVGTATGLGVVGWFHIHLASKRREKVRRNERAERND